VRTRDWDHGYGGGHDAPRFTLGPARVPPIVRTLLIANVAIFVIQVLFSAATNVDLERIFGVSHLYLVERLWVWQPFTYMFLHSPTGLMHIAFNMLSLWWFGSPLEDRLGSRRFLLFYLTAGIVAGLVYATFAIFDHTFAVPAIGASGAVLGVVVHLALLDPNRVVLFLMLFPIRLKYVAALLVGIDLFYFLGMQGGGGNVAHTAHLGGAAYGYLHFRFAGAFHRFFERVEAQAGRDRAKRDVSTREEVDRLLAKISAEGIGSLTDREKRFLKRSSKRFG